MSLAGSVLSSNISILAFVFLAARLINNRYQSTRRKYPPGPPGKPILGNIFDFNVTAPWHSFITWKEIYGMLKKLVLVHCKSDIADPQETSSSSKYWAQRSLCSTRKRPSTTSSRNGETSTLADPYSRSSESS